MTVNLMKQGLVYGMSDEDYHRDPVGGGSLSSTFARLLTEHVPAKALLLRKKPPTPAMEFGSLMHRIALGFEDPEDYSPNGLMVIEGDGRTKAVKEAKARAIEAGYEPVGESEWERRAALYEQLTGMRDALHGDERVSHLLNGKREVSAFWQDEATGVWLRARFDVLDEFGRRPVDYKTTTDASRRGFQKSMAKFGYHQQADLYNRALTALGITRVTPRFNFVTQETEPPYLVNVHYCDGEAMEAARVLNDRAIRLYAACMQSGEWPGYQISRDPLSLPQFYFYDHEEALA